MTDTSLFDQPSDSVDPDFVVARDIETLKGSYAVSPIDLYLIRYEITAYVYTDGDQSIVHVYKYLYPVTRLTNACYVIDVHGKEKFVLKEAIKAFAYVEDAKAVNSMRKRVRWRRYYAQMAMDRAVMAEAALNQLLRDRGLR